MPRCACSYPAALVAIALGGLIGAAGLVMGLGFAPVGDPPAKGTPELNRPAQLQPVQPANRSADRNRPRPIEPGFVLPEDRAAEVNTKMEDPRFVLGYDIKRITGEPEHLMKYQGDVVLMVNVASECGYTRQYEGLEKVYRTLRDEGFVVLGFPANNFGGQEPGSNAEIMEFCTGRFDASFPMFTKISVKGEDQHPLYERLAALPEPDGGGPKWNFTKYLVGRDGRVIKKYESAVEPNDPKLMADIRAALAQPRPDAG